MTWRAEKDKAGRETVTLLRAEAVELLKGLPHQPTAPAIDSIPI